MLNSIPVTPSTQYAVQQHWKTLKIEGKNKTRNWTILLYLESVVKKKKAYMSNVLSNIIIIW